MTRAAATRAIVRTRLRKEAGALALCCCAAAVLAYLQRFQEPAAQLAGSLVVGTLAGISIGLLQRAPRRMRELQSIEMCAPLYGRELARATALVPAAIVTACLAAYWCVAEAYAYRGPEAIALSVVAANAATAFALPAGLARGAQRMAYVAGACALACAAFALSKTPVVATGVCIFGALWALRAYGEALARFDPFETIAAMPFVPESQPRAFRE